MKHIAWAGLAAAALAVACNDNDPTALARVQEVRLLPEDTTVEHPDSFRYRVQLLDENGDPITDTRPVEFTPSDYDVVFVSPGGFVRTREGGLVEVNAEVGGTTGTASLTVQDTAANPVE